MTIRVTITKPGVTDAYGIAMVVGTTYTVEENFGLSLISQGRATDTDASLVNPGVTAAQPGDVVYCNAATLAAPTAQMLASYNVQFALDVAPFTRYQSNGTALVASPTISLNGKTIQYAGSTFNPQGMSSYYKFYIPGFQYVGSGNAKDKSGNSADAVIAAAYTDADTWQNKGYITTEAGTEQYLTIPAAKVTIDLTQKSRLFAGVINRAAPAGNDSIFGNSNGTTLTGWAISCKTTGKFYIKTDTNGSSQTITADSTAVPCDSTDHAFLLYWARDSRTISFYMDGTLSDTFSSAWDVNAYIPESRDFAIGGLFQAASQTSVALKTYGLHLMEIPGDLPTNIGLIAQKHAANPRQWLTDADFEF